MPEFLDVLRNYDSGALAQDSLVRRLRLAGRRVVFYGDDTWVRLFPDSFLRHDGTHSFFVSDYTEVRLPAVVKWQCHICVVIREVVCEQYIRLIQIAGKT